MGGGGGGGGGAEWSLGMGSGMRRQCGLWTWSGLACGAETGGENCHLLLQEREELLVDTWIISPQSRTSHPCHEKPSM